MAKRRSAKQQLDELGLNETGDESYLENFERAEQKRRAAKVIKATDAEDREESAVATLVSYAKAEAERGQKARDKGKEGADERKRFADIKQAEWQRDYETRLAKNPSAVAKRGCT